MLPTLHLENLIFYYTTSSILFWVYGNMSETEKPGELRDILEHHSWFLHLNYLQHRLIIVHSRIKLCSGIAENVHDDGIKWIVKGYVSVMLVLNIIGLFFSLVLILLKWEILSHYCRDATSHAKSVLITLALRWSQKAVPLCLWSQSLIPCL